MNINTMGFTTRQLRLAAACHQHDLLLGRKIQPNIALYVLTGANSSGLSMICDYLINSSSVFTDGSVLVGGAWHDYQADYSHRSHIIPQYLSLRFTNQVELDKLIDMISDRECSTALLDVHCRCFDALQAACKLSKNPHSSFRFIPIIVFDARNYSKERATYLLELFSRFEIQHCFLIYNPYNADRSYSIPHHLRESNYGMNITRITIPTLRSDLAKALVSNGFPMKQIIEGDVDTIPVLSSRMTCFRITEWALRTATALAPLIKDITSQNNCVSAFETLS